MVPADRTSEASERRQEIVRSHPWELAGMGRAPFSYVGMDKTKGDGCHYCGTGIVYRFHCVSSDGKRFHVGCDCIRRCHEPSETIVVKAEKALKEYKRRERSEKKAESRKAQREAREAQWAAEREAIKAKLANDPLYLRIVNVVGVATRDSGGFLADMRDAMERWGALTDKQETAVLKVLDRIESAPARKAASYWLGALDERVSFVATVEFTRCIYQGDGTIYDPDRWMTKLRTDDGAAVTWFGAYPLKEGKKVAATARIKKLDVYQDEKQTLIKNPRWKDAE